MRELSEAIRVYRALPVSSNLMRLERILARLPRQTSERVYTDLGIWNGGSAITLPGWDFGAEGPDEGELRDDTPFLDALFLTDQLPDESPQGTLFAGLSVTSQAWARARELLSDPRWRAGARPGGSPHRTWDDVPDSDFSAPVERIVKVFREVSRLYSEDPKNNAYAPGALIRSVYDHNLFLAHYIYRHFFGDKVAMKMDATKWLWVEVESVEHLNSELRHFYDHPRQASIRGVRWPILYPRTGEIELIDGSQWLFVDASAEDILEHNQKNFEAIEEAMLDSFLDWFPRTEHPEWLDEDGGIDWENEEVQEYQREEMKEALSRAGYDAEQTEILKKMKDLDDLKQNIIMEECEWASDWGGLGWNSRILPRRAGQPAHGCANEKLVSEVAEILDTAPWQLGDFTVYSREHIDRKGPWTFK